MVNEDVLQVMKAEELNLNNVMFHVMIILIHIDNLGLLEERNCYIQ